MADRRTVVKVDDIDPSIDEDVRTVALAYRGVEYEIDLGPRHRAALEEALAPFIEAARPTRVATPRRAHHRAEAAAIRAWAAERGIVLQLRGRIPGDVRARYLAERSG